MDKETKEDGENKKNTQGDQPIAPAFAFVTQLAVLCLQGIDLSLQSELCVVVTRKEACIILPQLLILTAFMRAPHNLNVVWSLGLLKLGKCFRFQAKHHI